MDIQIQKLAEHFIYIPQWIDDGIASDFFGTCAYVREADAVKFAQNASKTHNNRPWTIRKMRIKDLDWDDFGEPMKDVTNYEKRTSNTSSGFGPDREFQEGQT